MVTILLRNAIHNELPNSHKLHPSHVRQNLVLMLYNVSGIRSHQIFNYHEIHYWSAGVNIIARYKKHLVIVSVAFEPVTKVWNQLRPIQWISILGRGTGLPLVGSSIKRARVITCPLGCSPTTLWARSLCFCE